MSLVTLLPPHQPSFLFTVRQSLIPPPPHCIAQPANNVVVAAAETHTATVLVEEIFCISISSSSSLSTSLSLALSHCVTCFFCAHSLPPPYRASCQMPLLSITEDVKVRGFVCERTSLHALVFGRLQTLQRAVSRRWDLSLYRTRTGQRRTEMETDEWKNGWMRDGSITNAPNKSSESRGTDGWTECLRLGWMRTSRFINNVETNAEEKNCTWTNFTPIFILFLVSVSSLRLNLFYFHTKKTLFFS